MQSTTIHTSATEQNLMQKVYTWMSFGLITTALVAFFVSTDATIINFIFSNSWVFIVTILIELGLVVYLSGFINKMSLQQAQFFFLLYAIVSGVTFSVIFLTYHIASIAMVFLITAGMFAAMSIYGAVTKRDLTSIGNFAFMALIGLIIATVVNIFLANPLIDLVLSYIGVVIFVALTAYDTQKIKQLVHSSEIAHEDRSKISIIGALTLYLDFINLFLQLLRIIGNRRD